MQAGEATPEGGPPPQPYAERLLQAIRADIEAASCVAAACGITDLAPEFQDQTSDEPPAGDPAADEGGAA